MKVKFSTVMTTLSGQAIPSSETESLTMGKVATTALMASYQDEQSVSGEEKFKRFRLASRIEEHGDEAEVSIEELALIKLLVGKGYVTEVVGRFYQNLEG